MSGRVVTLDDRARPDLVQLQSRRRRLLALFLVAFVALATGIIVLSWLRAGPGPEGLAFLGVAVALSVYLYVQERALARVERDLVGEQILSASLSGRLGQLRAIDRAGRAMASTLSLEEVLGTVLDSARDVLGATEGSLMLVEDGTLRVAASAGLDEQVARDASVPLGQGVAGWVAERREPVILRGDLAGERFRGFEPKGRRVRSAMCAPLLVRGEPVGVLNVSVSEGDREYTEHDLRALTAFAEHAAIAVDNARRYSREQEQAHRLAEVDARRREFLGTITHDLKGPITSILGFVQLLQDATGRFTPDQATEFMAVIERQGRRILEMVEEMLLAIRLEEGKPVLEREPLDLEELVARQVETTQGVLGERRISVTIPDEVPLVFGDPSAVGHMIANLLDNAVKYSPEGSKIEIAVEPRADGVRVLVTDEGEGIPEDELDEVFERFSRSEDTPAGTHGVGLGLFIVRSLAEAHGGRAWAENVPGGGARVSFTLPLRSHRDGPAAAPG